MKEVTYNMKASSLSRKSVMELSQVQSDTCVSLLMSTSSSGPESRQGAVRFKNLVHNAQTALHQRNLREDEIEKLLSPSQHILSDRKFWSHQMEGLAVYLENGSMRLYQLPFTVPDRVVVGDCFHVRPLLKAIEQESFYVLDLNLNHAQLLRCDAHGVSEFVPEGFPDSLVSAMMPNSSESSSSLHNGGHPEVHHHVRMGVEENRKMVLEEWLRTLARSVETFLGDESSPLVLAGVKYVIAEYRKHDRYQHTVDEVISGSTEKLSANELGEMGRRKLERLKRERFENLLEIFQSELSEGRSVAGLAACLREASTASVEHLLVAEGLTEWGSFSAETFAMEILNDEHPGALELFERACLDTLKNGGRVSVVPVNQMPNESQIAAILRFPSVFTPMRDGGTHYRVPG